MLCSLYCFLQFAIIVLDSGQFLIRQFHDLHKALDGLACFDESRLMLAHNPERHAKPVATSINGGIPGIVAAHNPEREAKPVATRRSSYSSRAGPMRPFASKTSKISYSRGLPTSYRVDTRDSADLQGLVKHDETVVCCCEHSCVAVPELRRSHSA